MQDLIVGYGYCGRLLAQHLQQAGRSVLVWSRTPPVDDPVDHQVIDLDQDDWAIQQPIDTVYYLAPPQRHGQTDERLARFLARLTDRPKTIIYFGSSGVYGNHHGQWVTEQSSLYLQFDRQQRRYHAEEQLFDYCRGDAINLACLRIAGIYGPGRLPVEKARQQKPVIDPASAPYSNCIYVADLIKIAVELGTTLQGQHRVNVSDGQPNPMGQIQQNVADALKIPRAPTVDYDPYYQAATPMVREFLASSKKIDNHYLTTLCLKLQLTSLMDGINASLLSHHG